MKSTSKDFEDNTIKSINSDVIENITSPFDYVNLKIASKPVKFYKLIHCEKNKINDYNHLCEKIKSASLIKNDNIILFLKTNGIEETKINNEAEWISLFGHSGNTILNFIDSKNTIKIEFMTVQISPMSSENLTLFKSNTIDDPLASKVDEKLKNYFEDDQVGMQILKSIFSISYKNDKIKSIIKSDLKSLMPKNENAELILNSKNFDTYLKNYFKKTLDNFQNISQFKDILIEELHKDDSNSEIYFESTEDEKILEVASFNDFYKEKEIEILRSKIISESFADFKK